jgi:hypothetical protein
MFNLRKIVNLFCFNLLINHFIVGKTEDYDQEEKDNIFKNKDDWNKFMKEQDKNGYIVYTNEFIETLEKIDTNGKNYPIISFIFTGSQCPGCRPFKNSNLIKNICDETNKVFSTYRNTSDNNQINYKVLFVLINVDEKYSNPVLTKLLHNLPQINSIPNVFFLCRNKDCVNKNCKKTPNKMRLINNYIGTYLPLTKWIKDILEDEDEGVLKKILTHSFKEK